MLNLLFGFIPWILLDFFPTKTHQELSASIIAAFLITIIFNYRGLKKGYLLPWGTAIFFAFAMITISFFNIDWIARNIWLLVFTVLSLIAWGSLLIGNPFTIQYAREQVEPAKWNNPVFIRINQILTLTWGSIFLFKIGLHIIQNYSLAPLPQSLLSNGATLFGIWFTIWFPKWYRK